MLTSDDHGNLADGSAVRGVMIYNTEHPSVPWKMITINGGSADSQLLPFELPESDPDHIYNNIIIFNDRNFPVYDEASEEVPKSIELNGGGSNLDLRGLVYSPRGQVVVNGNSDADDKPLELTLDKIIAGTFTFNGNGGSLLALNGEDYDPEGRYVGLIE